MTWSNPLNFLVSDSTLAQLKKIIVQFRYRPTKVEDSSDP